MLAECKLASNLEDVIFVNFIAVIGHGKMNNKGEAVFILNSKKDGV